MAITVREARADDAERVLAFMHDVLAEPGLSIPLQSDEFTYTLEQEQTLLQEYATAPNSVFLLAETSDAEPLLVGCLNCQGGRRRADRHAVSLGITVRAGWRGRGVGSALLQHAVEWATATALVHRIELNVYARNTDAIRLYERFGFAHEGRRRASIREGDTYLDDVLMARIL